MESLALDEFVRAVLQFNCLKSRLDVYLVEVWLELEYTRAANEVHLYFCRCIQGDGGS